MSDEKKYTERDLVLAKREGWVDCDREFVSTELPRYDNALARSRRMAAKHYPLPKVTRPRVVRDGSVLFRLVDGQIQASNDEGRVWDCIAQPGYATKNGWGVAITPLRVIALYDLINRPTEEVEDDS